MPRSVAAMEAIPAIRGMLEQLEGRDDELASGKRAALWRAQQRAARVEHTLDDLRNYCLDTLRPRRFPIETEEQRGFTQGFQAVLTEIRRLES